MFGPKAYVVMLRRFRQARKWNWFADDHGPHRKQSM